jgi:hypothetical protein
MRVRELLMYPPRAQAHLGLIHSNQVRYQMFRKLSDDYRSQAAQQISDAEELESGRWRIRDQDGDQSSSTASSKRSLAARLLGLSKAYKEIED